MIMELKVIGIYGKSGAGKSTAARYLSEKLDRVKILEVDKMHINYLLTKKSDRLKELFGDDIIVDGTLNTIHFINFPEKQKIIFDESFDDLEEMLLKEIDYAKERYDWIIIDFFRLVELKRIWNLCRYRILVEAKNDDLRYENIAKRYEEKGKNITRTREEEFRLRDYFIGDYSKYEHNFHLLNSYDDNFIKDLDNIIEENFL